MKIMFMSYLVAIVSLYSCNDSGDSKEVDSKLVKMTNVETVANLDTTKKVVELDFKSIEMDQATYYMLKYNKWYKSRKSIFAYDINSNAIKENLFYNSTYNLILSKSDSSNTSSYIVLHDKSYNKDFHVIQKQISTDTIIYYLFDDNFAGFGLYTTINDTFVFYNISLYDNFRSSLKEFDGDVYISNSQFSIGFLINYKYGLYRNIWKINSDKRGRYYYSRLANQDLSMRSAYAINATGKRSLNEVFNKIRDCGTSWIENGEYNSFEKSTKLDFVFYNPLLYVCLLRNDEEKKNMSICK